MLQLSVGRFLAVGNDLLAAVDPFHGSGGAEVYFLGLKTAGAGVEDDSGFRGHAAVNTRVLVDEGEKGEEKEKGREGPDGGLRERTFEVGAFAASPEAVGGMEELDWVGGVEESTCFGVALAEGDKA